MPLEWLEQTAETLSEESALTLAIAILLIGLVISYLVWRWVHAVFNRLGLQDAVEGTSVERGAGRFGTPTVGILAGLFAISVFAVAVLGAFNVARVLEFDLFWPALIALLPQLLIAVLALIFGLLLGDKAHLVVQERLRSIKLPEAAIIPEIVKYSIIYIAILIALAQVGVATTALLILLAAYAFGVVILSVVAFQDLLAAGAAGIYLVLNEPYVIGDEIRVNDSTGIVQEINMFVTHIEDNGEEYIIPNHKVFTAGVVRIRE